MDKMMSVEHTKGNNGVEGRLLATTLRLIWKKSNHMYTNLSIGYNCIVSVSPLPHPPSSSPRTAPPGPGPCTQWPRLWHRSLRPWSPRCHIRAPELTSRHPVHRTRTPRELTSPAPRTTAPARLPSSR